MLPGNKQYSREDVLDNPFGMYCGYLDILRPIELESKEKWLKEKCDEMEQKL